MLTMSLWSVVQTLLLQPVGKMLIFAFKSLYLIPHRSKRENKVLYKPLPM